MGITPALGGVTITTLFAFQGTNGTNPEGKLVQDIDGNLYGTTRDTSAQGGNYGFHWFGSGTIFEITTNGTFKTLFAFRGTNGAFPRSGLVFGEDGNLYGTNAGAPVAELALGKHGMFYGTTVDGGAKRDFRTFGDGPIRNNGTVFTTDKNGALDILVRFNGTNEANPYAKVIRSEDGSLYGSTAYDGLDDSATNNPNHHGFGTIFKVLPDGSVTTLVVFNGTNGIGGNALTMDNAGNLFGTTTYGGKTYSVTNDPYDGPSIRQGDGTIFKISKSGKLTTLVHFYGANGKHPSELILGHDGNLYGFTSEGGAFGKGTLFRLKPDGTFAILHSFSGVGDDEGISTLMHAKDGYFYGVGVGSFLGGSESKFKCGRVFRLIIDR